MTKKDVQLKLNEKIQAAMAARDEAVANFGEDSEQARAFADEVVFLWTTYDLLKAEQIYTGYWISGSSTSSPSTSGIITGIGSGTSTNSANNKW